MAPEIVPLSMKIEFWRWVVVKKDTNYPGGVTGLKGVSKIFDENKEKKRKKYIISILLKTSRTNVTRMRSGEKNQK